ncbi:hypothetical protein [Providencia burhodogranariea]|uniref:Lipoprotein n=1 Tax=Providencia burhodogranariea DSM 19968 TaxID=1141662 RepID=K8W4M4_9GAMM|nr:hypothetical protein [Providencia burhodogranariea]EKT55459.1 hypothetical protein OOA_16749 [Providencia burhodogranariea DSM 19968]
MKKDIVLSIIVGSVLTMGAAATAVAAEPSQANRIENKAPTSSGKCASGKCGTEKIYGQATLKHDPQDQMVRARDGKCGLTGEGIKQDTPKEVKVDKCVGGVCGK